MWVIKGKILDVEGFKKYAERCTEHCSGDQGVKICWWANSADSSKYCNLCYFDDEQSAKRCLEMWGEMADDLKASITLEKCLVFGDPSGYLREVMAHMSPKIMGYMTGFEKQEPISTENRDVFAIVKGTFTDQKVCEELMAKLAEETKEELGAYMQQCFFDSESKRFCVVERYMDREAAKAHHRTWEAIMPELEGCATISKIIVLCGAPDQVAELRSAEKHLKMAYCCGFAR